MMTGFSAAVFSGSLNLTSLVLTTSFVNIWHLLAESKTIAVFLCPTVLASIFVVFRLQRKYFSPIQWHQLAEQSADNESHSIWQWGNLTHLLKLQVCMYSTRTCNLLLLRYVLLCCILWLNSMCFCFFRTCIPSCIWLLFEVSRSDSHRQGCTMPAKQLFIKWLSPQCLSHNQHFLLNVNAGMA